MRPSILGYEDTFRVTSQGIRYGTKLYRAKRYCKPIPKIDKDGVTEEMALYAKELFMELHTHSSLIGVFRDIFAEDMIDHYMMSAELIVFPMNDRFQGDYEKFMERMVEEAKEKITRSALEGRNMQDVLEECYALHDDLEFWLQSYYGPRNALESR